MMRRENDTKPSILDLLETYRSFKEQMGGDLLIDLGALGEVGFRPDDAGFKDAERRLNDNPATQGKFMLFSADRTKTAYGKGYIKRHLGVAAYCNIGEDAKLAEKVLRLSGANFVSYSINRLYLVWLFEPFDENERKMVEGWCKDQSEFALQRAGRPWQAQNVDIVGYHRGVWVELKRGEVTTLVGGDSLYCLDDVGCVVKGDEDVQ